MGFFDWLPWITGGSILSIVALAFLAPTVLTVAASWLTALSPLIQGAARGVVAFVRVLWYGLLDMLDNGKSIIFVLTIAALAFAGGKWNGTTTVTVANPEVIYQKCNGKRVKRATPRSPAPRKKDWRQEVFRQP